MRNIGDKNQRKVGESEANESYWREKLEERFCSNCSYNQDGPIPNVFP